ncbi:MAG: hypothetical protein DRO96_00285 [Candidatus Aenigmatarchaeota archaeon]|nr:MAG: hypothetical protein B6U68_02855 [Candidatus Aenigmarchaeota archaeon ex4484_14]RLI97573.1 MAG: hypothetical protein DRO96_00285 [Candidatus Aenigmarchaeota archaeon]
MKEKTKTKIMGISTMCFFIAGITLNHFNIGVNFPVFSSLGNWLIYAGFVELIMVAARLTLGKKLKRETDERMEFVATKALRITFLSFIALAFVIMIIDGIKTITMPYSIFVSYLVCFMLVIYFISYRVLLRFY